MRQRNYIKRTATATERKNAPDNFVEFCEWNELRDGKFADWNDEAGAKQCHFVIHPCRAVPNLFRDWHAIAAC